MGRRLLAVAQRLAGSRLFVTVGPVALPAVDRAVYRLTGGRAMFSGALAPCVLLTARGARSGRPRRTPLVCVPERERGSWVVIGSNFGRPAHPAWTANLRRYPEAEISWRGEDIPVRARLLEGDERVEAWAAVLRSWPLYATYQARVAREIRLFRLERRRGGTFPGHGR